MTRWEFTVVENKTHMHMFLVLGPSCWRGSNFALFKGLWRAETWQISHPMGPCHPAGFDVQSSRHHCIHMLEYSHSSKASWDSNVNLWLVFLNVVNTPMMVALSHRITHYSPYIDGYTHSKTRTHTRIHKHMLTHIQIYVLYTRAFRAKPKKQLGK